MDNTIATNSQSFDMTKILEFVGKLYEEKNKAIIEALELRNKRFEAPIQSESLDQFAVDFAKAQAEYKVAGKTKSNPYFKSSYADLEAVVEASRPALTKYGFSVLQDPVTYSTGETILHTRVIHKSGQWMESRMRIIPAKNDIQSMSSYNTFLKRVAYSSLLGVVTGDEDDDGEMAVATQRETFAKGTALNAKYNPKDQPTDVITKEQLDELEYELSEYPDVTEQVLNALKIMSLADMPKSKYMISLQRIREINNTRNGKK